MTTHNATLFNISKDSPWESLAFLFAHVLPDEIIHAALKTPDSHLRGYMNRYWLISPEEAAREALPHTARVHQILTKDNDRHLHNHPWSFRSIVLSGWYDEELLLSDGSVMTKRYARGDTYTRTAADYHRITAISSEPLWTVCFFTDCTKSGWGFLTEHGHVDSHTYLDYALNETTVPTPC